jgi:pyruvate formate lyase activating enzyme
LSFCDWPGRATSVLFLGGCDLRCPGCHNADLAWRPETLPSLPREPMLAFLKNRRKWLDGLVISGGEPTLFDELPLLLRELREIGLPIKLDTNGMRPQVVELLLDEQLVDVFAVDVKGPYAKYPFLTGGKVAPEAAERRLKHIFSLAERAPGAFYFRTTRVPGLTDVDIAEARSYPPSGFSLILQQYQEPRRKYAQADPQTRRSSGNVVRGPHRPSHFQSAQS